MAFKLLAMAEGRWRRVNAPQLVPVVRAGVAFHDGVAFERSSMSRVVAKRTGTKKAEEKPARSKATFDLDADSWPSFGWRRC